MRYLISTALGACLLAVPAAAQTWREIPVGSEHQFFVDTDSIRKVGDRTHFMARINAANSTNQVFTEIAMNCATAMSESINVRRVADGNTVSEETFTEDKRPQYPKSSRTDPLYVLVCGS